MLSNIRFARCAVVALQSRNGAIAGLETDNGKTTFCGSALARDEVSRIDCKSLILYNPESVCLNIQVYDLSIHFFISDFSLIC